MSDDDAKASKDEGKRPGASLWTKNKKERVGEETNTRVATAQPFAQPKTPIASKLRKDAQAKALAAEKVATSGEMEGGISSKETEEVEKRIKKKRRQ
jgi:hypothetical protein